MIRPTISTIFFENMTLGDHDLFEDFDAIEGFT